MLTPLTLHEDLEALRAAPNPLILESVLDALVALRAAPPQPMSLIPAHHADVLVAVGALQSLPIRWWHPAATSLAPLPRAHHIHVPRLLRSKQQGTELLIGQDRAYHFGVNEVPALGVEVLRGYTDGAHEVLEVPLPRIELHLDPTLQAIEAQLMVVMDDLDL